MDRNLDYVHRQLFGALSLSARRAWIEIQIERGEINASSVALRKESVDRNIPVGIYKISAPVSLSARRAWIEIGSCDFAFQHRQRSLSARRAWIEIQTPQLCALSLVVALRKESVDRNATTMFPSTSLPDVALRKESVDRNTLKTGILPVVTLSLSARRAWIEMEMIHETLKNEYGRSPQGERG